MQGEGERERERERESLSRERGREGGGEGEIPGSWCVNEEQATLLCGQPRLRLGV